LRSRATTAAVMLILAACGSAAAQTDPRTAALTVLAEELAKPGSGFSRDMLLRVGAATGLADDTLRTEMRALFDDLDAERRNKTAAWKELTALGGEDVDVRKTDRLLREFIAWGRKATRGNSNYGMDLIIERSAEKARLPTYRSRELLVQFANLGLTGSAVPAAGLPEKLGLLITGQSEYRVDPSRFLGMLISEEDISRQTRLRDIHVPLVTGLVEALPEAEGVRWAIDGSHPRLQPDAVLLVTVTDLFSRRFRRDVDLYVKLRLALRTTAGVLLYSTDMELTYDYWLEPDALVRSQRRLDAFLLKITAAARDEVGRYLESRLVD